jgi:hypothetical protein
VASLHVARVHARTEATNAEVALDRLASILGTAHGITGLGATPRALIVYAQSRRAAREVRERLPGLSFLRWPVEVQWKVESRK